MRRNTQGIADSHLEVEKNLKGTTLPILAELRGAIKDKSKQISSGVAKDWKSVQKSREASQKHIDLLARQLESSGIHISKPDPNNDPYVIHRGIYHRLNKQINEENENRRDLLQAQHNFQQFEAYIVDKIKLSVTSFHQFVAGQSDRQKGIYEDIHQKAHVINGDFEWNAFAARNKDRLLDPNAPARHIEKAAFLNQNHAATQPIIEGTLERKGKLLKSYNSGYYVVTQAKFLHEYKDNENFKKDPTPELSLYLPDCTIGAVAGQKFVVKGKDTSKGKLNAFSQTHELAFKAASAAEAEKWQSALATAIGKTTAGETPPTSEASSPVASRQTSGTLDPPSKQTTGVPGTEQHPPTSGAHGPGVQTTGITGGEVTATPASAGPGSAGPVGSPGGAAPASAGTHGPGVQTMGVTGGEEAATTPASAGPRAGSG